MSENVDITKYFRESSPVSDIFDNISGDAPQDIVKNQSSEEPAVCKLFTAPVSKPASQADASNFFDIFSSEAGVKSDGARGVSLHTDELLNTNDVLKSFSMYNETMSKLNVSEVERSYDAWILPEHTRKAFISMVTSPPGTFVPDRTLLTMPGVVLEEEMKDTVYEAVAHYLGQEAASARNVLTASKVTQDDRGLRDLIAAGCYRAAVNLTKSLLTMYGQGPGRAGHPSKHTVHSIQLWFTRLALLVKLRSFSLAAVESEPFGNLDMPDMFFQFYPELYGGRLGSIVPFSFRLLVAELPGHLGKHRDALTKLHALLSTIRKMLSNLDKGLFEDGTPSELSVKDRDASVSLWRSRESRVLHSVVNCALGCKDFTLAIEVVQILIQQERNEEKLSALNSALGRILLQLGDIVSAEKQFAVSQSAQMECAGLVDAGLVLVAQNQFQEAFNVFEKAVAMNPTNVTAINNMSVCKLYLGQLKEAVLLLEAAIKEHPELSLHESFLLNLCTMYELQSPHSSEARLKLLSLVSKHKGDGFNLSCLKLQM